MAIKKSLMVAGAVASIGLAGATGLHSVSAESQQAGLVDKLAQKFNLSKEDVQAVVDEHHQEKKAEHQARIEQKLNAAIAEGKLTEEQKHKILAKLEELKENQPDKSELENLSKEERKAQLQQRHDELKKWAADNNIPEELLPIRLHIKTGSGGGEGIVLKED